MHDRRGTIGKRVGKRVGWVNPLQTETFERPRAEKRGSDPERVKGRTYIVSISRQRQFVCACAAADFGPAFENTDSPPRLGQRYCSGQAVWPGSNYNGIKLGGHGFLWQGVRALIARLFSACNERKAAIGDEASPFETGCGRELEDPYRNMIEKRELISKI